MGNFFRDLERRARHDLNNTWDAISSNPALAVLNPGFAAPIAGAKGASEAGGAVERGAAGGAAGTYLSGGLNLLAGDQNKDGGPQLTSESARMKQLREGLKADSDKFAGNLDNYKREQFQGLLPAYNQALEKGTRNVREGAGRRGLLYSGLAQKGEREMRGQLASQMDRSKVAISQDARSLAMKKAAAATASGLQNAAMLMQQSEQYYNLSMQNQLNRRKALGAIAQGAGEAAGTYFGSGGNNQESGGDFGGFATQTGQDYYNL